MAPRPPEYTASQRALLEDVAQIHAAKVAAEASVIKLDKEELRVAERAIKAHVQVGSVGDALGMTRSGFLSRRKRAAVAGPKVRKKAAVR
jgi:hypothetical protein